MKRLIEWGQEIWEEFIWRMYKRSFRYTESLMHDALCHDLLDQLGAPRTADDDKAGKLSYGVYGRLRHWALEKKLVSPADTL